MAGGGIGVDYTLRNLPRMLPGLLLCLVFGWLALQWDATIHNWQREYKEAAVVLSSVKEGKASADYNAYKQAKDDKYMAALGQFEKGLESKKPSKPFVLKKDTYESVYTSGTMPTKLEFGNLMIQIQMTYVAVLLLLGMLIRNTIGLPAIFQAGTIAARPIIKPGIVILGAYYLWSDVLRVGVIGLLLVVAFVMGTAVLICFWGRKGKVDDGLAGVMAAGAGVCGVSAAVAVAPVVNAKPRDFFYAIGTILLFGTLCLFTFPYIGQLLGMSQPVFGAWVGTAILNTAQLVAAATWYGHQSLLTANIINIVRVGFIPLIVLWAIYFYVIKPAAACADTTKKLNVLQVIREKFPIFILGFFVMVTLNELGFFTQTQRDVLGKDLLKIFFAIGFAGVGLNIAFGDLRKAGGKAFAIGFIAATLKAILAAAAVMLIGAEAFTVK
ncbi:MAG: putative sulfate exporter family transporter [Deltaproteobacteria bacterium]|nr:putative sulfate exporter family transporter [Deltaproteobacteria bacterium]